MFFLFLFFISVVQRSPCSLIFLCVQGTSEGIQQWFLLQVLSMSLTELRRLVTSWLYQYGHVYFAVKANHTKI
uniref:Uncharacterized protein n=1 Tax=Oryza brachyantha TaxID=4533 RepID=J3MCT0_ORYBR